MKPNKAPEQNSDLGFVAKLAAPIVGRDAAVRYGHQVEVQRRFMLHGEVPYEVESVGTKNLQKLIDAGYSPESFM